MHKTRKKLNVIILTVLGFLFKCYYKVTNCIPISILDSVLLKSYQKRYCILKDNILYYYEKPTDKRQLGAFVLKGKNSLHIL